MSSYDCHGSWKSSANGPPYLLMDLGFLCEELATTACRESACGLVIWLNSYHQRTEFITTDISLVLLLSCRGWKYVKYVKHCNLYVYLCQRSLHADGNTYLAYVKKFHVTALRVAPSPPLLFERMLYPLVCLDQLFFDLQSPHFPRKPRPVYWVTTRLTGATTNSTSCCKKGNKICLLRPWMTEVWRHTELLSGPKCKWGQI